MGVFLKFLGKSNGIYVERVRGRGIMEVQGVLSQNFEEINQSYFYFSKF